MRYTDGVADTTVGVHTAVLPTPPRAHLLVVLLTPEWMHLLAVLLTPEWMLLLAVLLTPEWMHLLAMLLTPEWMHLLAVLRVHLQAVLPTPPRAGAPCSQWCTAAVWVFDHHSESGWEFTLMCHVFIPWGDEEWLISLPDEYSMIIIEHNYSSLESCCIHAY